MQDLDITIGREEDPTAGNMVGHLFCLIKDHEECQWNYKKYYIDSLCEVGKVVDLFIGEKYEDDGASICYRVR